MLFCIKEYGVIKNKTNKKTVLLAFIISKHSEEG